jgi:hypothetical protein
MQSFGMANTDAAKFEVLAENYRSEADTCLEMAEQLDGALRTELVRAAVQWIELAREAEAHRRPN